MKVKYHIPTEQYGFVEVEGEVESIGEAVTNYEQAQSNEGLPPHQWAKVRDHYVNTGEIDEETFNELSRAQRWFINEIKKVIRANKR